MLRLVERQYLEILSPQSGEIGFGKADDLRPLVGSIRQEPFDLVEALIDRRGNPGRRQGDDHEWSPPGAKTSALRYRTPESTMMVATDALPAPSVRLAVVLVAASHPVRPSPAFIPPPGHQVEVVVVKVELVVPAVVAGVGVIHGALLVLVEDAVPFPLPR